MFEVVLLVFQRGAKQRGRGPTGPPNKMDNTNNKNKGQQQRQTTMMTNNNNKTYKEQRNNQLGNDK
jgi:hypothetical protein